VSGQERGDWIGPPPDTALEANAADPQPKLPDGSGFYLNPGPTPSNFDSTAIADSSFQIDASATGNQTIPCSGDDATGFGSETQSMNDEWIVVPAVSPAATTSAWPAPRSRSST
jgi:hypothetical protein